MTNHRRLLIGCVADDFTGATDVAGIFAKSGMKTTVLIDVPEGGLSIDADVVVIALKTRTAPPSEAVRQSLAALRWLRDRGSERIYFKYCSTFDSTANGNIGPVIDAMLEELDSGFTIACPAFPANGRTIYKGNLFVGDVPLNESGMKQHPLTPMTDSNLVRVLSPQTRHKVTACYRDTVSAGVGEVRAWADKTRADGFGVAIVDAIADEDLEVVAQAFADTPLLTGASGLALGLATVLFKDRPTSQSKPEFASTHGSRAVVSGSCSVATNGQVAAMLRGHEGFKVDVASLAAGEDVVSAALGWAADRLGRKPILFYATANPEEVKANQSSFGIGKAGEMVESALARIAGSLVDLGVSELIVAGGETSGAVVKHLGINQLDIGNEIAPGVPWVSAPLRSGQLWLALKSGNFGGREFFVDAWDKIR
ncbi:3-oxo-tetronate kinase [Ensifer sp. B1-9]|uniref:3-oxo-tetronate kinase n=1 Tax=Ensifer sp. B1-9 TaxID=3141455 RepID=UPI003D1B0800